MACEQLILDDILAERRRQDRKWGEQNHSIPWWLLILSEEIGELSKAVLVDVPDGQIRKELVQVAAVAFAMVESFDRYGRAGRS